MTISESENIFIKKFSEFPGIPGKPLSGLKFAVKDMIEIKSYPLTFGLNPAFLETSQNTAFVVQKLLDSGASLIGCTNLDPGAMGISGKNPYYGNVKNPLDNELALGGSSGAAAAAVTLAHVDFALVSDHGGSARMPASLCEVFGIKLTPNFIDQSGCVLLDQDIDGLGIIARNADLASKILSVLSKRSVKLTFNTILIPREDDLRNARPEITAEFAQLVRRLSGRYQIKEIGINLNLEQMTLFRKIIISRLFLEKMKAYNTDKLPDDLSAILTYARGITLSEFSKANEKVFEQRKFVQDAIGQNILITPLFPVPKKDLISFTKAVNLFMNISNLAGLPALNLSTTPLPTQIIGPEFSEISLCDAASSLENI